MYTYTGNGSPGAKIAHGLGATPAMIITKSITSVQPWRVYHKSLTADYAMILNDNSQRDDDATAWNDTEPDSVNFTVGTSANTNGDAQTFIAYCFAELAGYSQFGFLHRKFK